MRSNEIISTGEKNRRTIKLAVMLGAMTLTLASCFPSPEAWTGPENAEVNVGVVGDSVMLSAQKGSWLQSELTLLTDELQDNGHNTSFAAKVGATTDALNELETLNANDPLRTAAGFLIENADVVVQDFGANDFRVNPETGEILMTTEQAIGNVDEFLDKSEAECAVIVGLNEFDGDWYGGAEGEGAARRNAWNAHWEGLAGQEPEEGDPHIVYVDWDQIVDAQPQQITQQDQIHLTPEGIVIFRQAAVDGVEDCVDKLVA